jgi:hypothetical protein
MSDDHYIMALFLVLMFGSITVAVGFDSCDRKECMRNYAAEKCR